MPVAPPFAGMPEILARLLLVGGRGAGLVPARDAVLAAGAPWEALADALALAAWGDAPLAPGTAAVLAAREKARPFLPPPVARTVQALADRSGASVPEPYYERLAARRDVPRMFAYLLERLRRRSDDPGLSGRLAGIAPMVPGGGGLAEAEAVLDGLGGDLAPLGAFAAGELALLDGRAAVAEERFRRCLTVLPLEGARMGLAEALRLQGGRAGALALLSAAFAARPFDSLLLSRLHDLATGLADRVAGLPGDVAVLVYSHNGAAHLDDTLAALAATDWAFAAGPGGGRIFVLDNGSTDGTPGVLAAWRDRLGERLAVVPLPVNIGAPAARNWLAALPGVRAAAFAAYLDDDAAVPADWLGRFGAAVEAYPDAGVWGSLVRGVDAPFFVQSADSHLFPSPRRDGGFGRAFELARPWLATPDCPRYAVCRPCASVTGCCHLFRTEVLTGLGGFDIRFSPSQYDDLDHDLRLLLDGRAPVCQGHLAVVHAKATGAAGNPGGAQYGSGFANQFKLHHKHDEAALARAAGTAFAALARDAARKLAALRELGLAAEEGGRVR